MKQVEPRTATLMNKRTNKRNWIKKNKMAGKAAGIGDAKNNNLFSYLRHFYKILVKS